MHMSDMPCLQDSMSMELQIRSSVRDRYASGCVSQEQSKAMRLYWPMPSANGLKGQRKWSARIHAACGECCLAHVQYVLLPHQAQHPT